MIKYLFITIFFFLQFAVSIAQVNTESLRKENLDNGFHFKLGAGITFADGNSNFAQLKPAIRIDFKNDNFYSFVSGNGEYKKGEGKLISDKAFLHFRQTIEWHDTFLPETFQQAEYNKFIELNSRYLAGGGIRFEPFKSDSSDIFQTFAFGLGLMYENENYSHGIETNLIRSTNYLSFKFHFTENTRFRLISYFQADVMRIADHRIIAESELSFKISKLFSFGVSLNYRFDNEPRPGIGKYDLELTNNFILKF